MTVTANSPSQSATTISDASGTFRFLTLAPDTYTLSFSKDVIRFGNGSGHFHFRRSGADRSTSRWSRRCERLRTSRARRQQSGEGRHDQRRLLGQRRRTAGRARLTGAGQLEQRLRCDRVGSRRHDRSRRIWMVADRPHPRRRHRSSRLRTRRHSREPRVRQRAADDALEPWVAGSPSLYRRRSGELGRARHFRLRQPGHQDRHVSRLTPTACSRRAIRRSTIRRRSKPAARRRTAVQLLRRHRRQQSKFRYIDNNDGSNIPNSFFYPGEPASG